MSTLQTVMEEIAGLGASPALLARVAALFADRGATDPHAERLRIQREKAAARQQRYAVRKRQKTSENVSNDVKEGVSHPEVPKEYISNPPTLTLPQETIPAAAATAGKYAFAGEVIKLTPKHFAEFRQDFPRIADLAAELRDADAFYVDTPPKDGKWWFALRGWLKKANQAAVMPTRAIQKPASGPTFDEGGRMTSW